MKKSTQINTTVWERWRRGRRRQRISPSVALESTAAPEITWTPFVSCHNLSVSSQTNRTKRQLYQCATCQAAIKLSVYESSFSRVSLNVKWVYTVVEWHYLRVEHRQTAKCHLTNLWVFFTTRWPCDPQLKNKSTSLRLMAAHCRIFRGQNSRLSCGTRRMSHLQSLTGNIRWRVKS